MTDKLPKLHYPNTWWGGWIDLFFAVMLTVRDKWRIRKRMRK